MFYLQLKIDNCVYWVIEKRVLENVALIGCACVIMAGGNYVGWGTLKDLY